MIWILCIFSFFLTSCDQKPQETQYKEIVVQAPQTAAPVVQAMPSDQAMTADPHAGLDASSMTLPPGMDTAANNNLFTWVAPEGWKEIAGGGMRLVTFHLLSDEKAIDCSLVSLGGPAGGLEANLRRWMGQIGVNVSDDELSSLITAAPVAKIKTGQEGKIFDFTTIQTKSQPTDKSMIVVMVVMNDLTLFVKMSGTVDTVSKNKDDFFKLVGSVVYHPPSADTPSQPVMPTTAPGTNVNPAGDPHAGLDMSAMGGVIEAATSQNILSWTSPDAWKEESGKHMRMVSFHAISDPTAIDCYIIALAGEAGGLEANLQRWLGQVGLQAIDSNVNELIVSAQTLKTKDGLDVKVFDFGALQSQGNPTDKSMIVAMIDLDKTTVFVKMTGTIQTVKDNKDNFSKLIGSILRK